MSTVRDESTTRGRPKDAAKREAILEAARTLFFQQGFQGVSIDAIAESAGVAKVTIYSHFGDKESLFGEVIGSLCDSMKLPRPPETVDRAGFRDLLCGFGIGLVGKLFSREMIGLDRLLISQAVRYPDLARTFFHVGPGAVHRNLTSLIALGAEADCIAVEDPDVAAEQLVGMWIGLNKLRHQLGLHRELSAEETSAYVADHVARCVAVFLRGYAPA